jgi:hypothetical protein
MRYLLLPALLVATVWSCGTDQAPTTQREASTMKMAQVSELALLMKEMHVQAKGWREMLLNEDLPHADVELYTRLVGSTPTNANVKGPVFEGFSANYQQQLDAFLQARSIDLARAQYNNLVRSCVQCHQSYCHGPIPTIEKLYIPEV